MSLSCLNFYMHWLVITRSSCAESCSKSNMLVGKVSYFGIILFTNSKWRLFILQFTWRLCKMSHDNPMIIGLSKMKWYWKQLCYYVIQLLPSMPWFHVLQVMKKRFWPSIISITIGVVFSINAKLCCHTNPLSMKHVDAP
jgi:hypothetical protein